MANKKINQLVSKTAILSTDLFGIGDATTGQLFKKTIAELQAAIGGAVISVNGLVGTVVLDTDDIQELATPTNKYFTDARARGAISLTVTGNSGASTYSSGTGVLNVPTYTLAGLGGITASFLSGTSGISYNSTTGVITYSGTVYTDASIRALFSGSTGISYNSTTGAISYSGTVYTDSSVRALISITTTGTSGASTYNNTTGVINVPEYTLAGLGGISLTSLSGGTGITYNNTTGAISYSGTVYTDASVRALVSAGTGLSYNNTTGVFTSTITQYTDALARASISITTTGTSGASTYNSTTGVLNVPQYQGAITLTTTGTSGAATFSSNTLNIPNYGSALSGYLPLTGGTLTGALGGTTASFSSTIQSAGDISIMNASGDLSLRMKDSGGNADRVLTRQPSSQNVLFGDIDANGGSAIIRANGNDSVTIATNSYATFIGNIFVTYSSNTVSANAFPRMGVSNTNATQQDYNLSEVFVSAGNGAVSGSLVASYSSSFPSSTPSVMLRNNGNSPLYFSTNGTIRQVITGGGNILLGTESDNGERLYVSGAIRATSTITANSDIRIKSNITKIENALEKVVQISGYTYNTTYDDKRHGGVIAQEIDKVFPEIVNTGNDGLMGVEYGNISALLIEAIKEQQTQIKELKALLNK